MSANVAWIRSASSAADATLEPVQLPQSGQLSPHQAQTTDGMQAIYAR